MSLGDLVLALIGLFGAIVAVGAFLLRIVGFSFGKGVLITVTFLCLGFWNPIGWIVLGLCIWLQAKENRARLLARRATQQVPPAFPARAKAGSVATAGRTHRAILRSEDQR